MCDKHAHIANSSGSGEHRESPRCLGLTNHREQEMEKRRPPSRLHKGDTPKTAGPVRPSGECRSCSCLVQWSCPPASLESRQRRRERASSRSEASLSGWKAPREESPSIFEVNHLAAKRARQWWGGT